MEKFEQSEQIILEEKGRGHGDEIKREKIEESFEKEWLEIMEEHINKFPEDIQEILRRRSTNLDSGEQGRLDRMRDKFWQEKFGIQFVKWS